MPKTYRHLYDNIIAFTNLHRAYLQARRNKRYRPEVLAFSANLEEELLQLRQELVTRSYHTGRYRRFTIREPKTRQVAALPFKDRVVHHALCNVIGPIFEATFIHDSYACRQEKGTHAGANRVTQFLRQAHREHGELYVLKGDIAQYFPSVDHAILLAIVKRKVKCPDTTWLIEEILDSWHTDGKPGKGLPIGNLTSQLWANLYLNELDQFVKHDLKCRWYVRYMDDWVILSNTKEQLQKIKALIADYLDQYLALQLNTKTNVFPAAQGIDFLGYRIWATHRLLRKNSVKRMKRKLSKFQRGYTDGSFELDHITASIMSWLGHASHADTYTLRTKLFANFTLRRQTDGNATSSPPTTNTPGARQENDSASSKPGSHLLDGDPGDPGHQERPRHRLAG